MVAIHFITEHGVPTPVGPHRVFLKLSLFDEWTEVPALHCDSVNFAAAPSYSTARLYWRYGVGKLPAELAFDQITRQGVNRYYVLIDLTELTTGDLLAFLGTVEVDADRLDGTGGGNTPSGRQALECYGIERLLDLQPIRSSWWQSTDDEPVAMESGTGFIFNEGGMPNRSAEPMDGAFVFANGTTDDAELWTSRTIAQYLLKRHAGIDFGAAAGEVAWELVDDTLAAPTFDKPVIETHGRTVWEILNQLFPRQRMLSFLTRLADSGEFFEIRPFTFAHEEINLGDAAGIPANPRQYELHVAQDHSAQVVVTRSSVDVVDRVIVEGALRTSTCTLVIDEAAELTEGWPGALETAYCLGASTAADYPASGEPAKRARRNKDARANAKFASVYSRFTLSNTFLITPLADGLPVFPDDDDEAMTHVVCPSRLAILPDLALLSGHLYDGSAIADDAVTTTSEGPFDRRPPMILTTLPDDPESDPDERQWIDVTVVGQTAGEEENPDDTNRKWSAEVRVPPGDRSIVVQVHGQPQHVIAATEMGELVPLADHGERDIAKFDYNDFTCTVTLEEDRRAIGKWPTGAVAQEIPRVKTIFAGDKYRCDYVVPDTVVDVFPGTCVRIKSEGGYLRDDRPLLEKIARLAHAWYGVERSSVTITSSVLEGQLIPGALLTSVADRAINACVTSLSIEIPRTTGSGNPGAPKATYTTSFGELDPLNIFPT